MQTAQNTDFKAQLLTICGRVKVDVYGAAYVSAIADLSTEDELRAQATYILCNTELWENDAEHLANIQLKAFALGQPLPTSLPAPANVLDDEQAEQIMLSFERATEKKVNRGTLITMDDVRNFSTRKNIPVDHVLACTDWTEECFDKETWSTKQAAENAVTIKRD